MSVHVVSGDRARRSTARRERLLFVARRPPFPLMNGSRIRTHRLLTGLAQQFETSFLTFDHHSRSADGAIPVDELRRMLQGIDVRTVPGSGPGKRLRQFRTVAERRSWEYGRYRRAAMGEALETLIADQRPAVVHFDDLGVAQFGPFDGVRNVYSSHNVEYRILESTVSHSGGLRRAFATIERRKVERLERNVWRSMDLCLACSEVDAGHMTAAGATAIVCPNGADPVPALEPRPWLSGEPLRLLFVGALNYRPNQLGLEWFVRHVLPGLGMRLDGDVVLDLVGTPPSSPPDRRDVIVHGRVPSVQPYYAAAHVVIVPVLFGSGTRLKMIEAMACGRPVVATSAGAEGLPSTAGLDYRCADTADEFAQAITDVAGACRRDDPEMARMLASARASVEPLMWPRIVADLTAAYAAGAPV